MDTFRNVFESAVKSIAGTATVADDTAKANAATAAGEVFDKVAAALQNGHVIEAVGSYDITTAPAGSAVSFMEMKGEMFAGSEMVVHVKEPLKEMALRHLPRENLVVEGDDFTVPPADGMDFKLLVRADRMWVVIVMPVTVITE